MKQVWIIAILSLIAAAAASVSANELTIEAVKDAGFFDLAPDNNLGNHSHVPVGVSNNNRQNHSVFDFDILGNIQSGATIEAATFQFDVSQQGGPAGQAGAEFDLHRVTRSWDEGSGTSNAGEITMDGATWNNATGTEPWTIPGGDFHELVIGSVFVDGAGSYSISTAQLVADIQDIVNGIEADNGFLLKPGESVPGSAARVTTRETGFPAKLIVTFSIEKVILGDVNLDGEVNLLDVSPFIDRLLTGVCQPQADINQDGDVDLLDVEPFVELLTGSGW